MPQLPLEVLSSVVSSLDPEEDRSTLAACMLASRALSDLAMPVLYSRVTMTTPQLHELVMQGVEALGERTRSARRLLKLSPRAHRMFALVKTLTLDFAQDDVELIPEMAAAATPGPDTPLFPNVRQFIIRGDRRIKTGHMKGHRLGKIQPPQMPPMARFFNKPDVCCQDMEDVAWLFPANAYGSLTLHTSSDSRDLPRAGWDSAHVFAFTTWEPDSRTGWWVKEGYPDVIYLRRPPRRDANGLLDGFLDPEPMPRGVKFIIPDPPVPCELCGLTWVDYALTVESYKERVRVHMEWCRKEEAREAREAEEAASAAAKQAKEEQKP